MAFFLFFLILRNSWFNNYFLDEILVGGLKKPLQSLYEIVAFPFQYPNLLKQFNIEMPKG